MNPIPIIYQNDEIYIINKPSGLAVQGGQGVTHSLDVEFSKQTGDKVFLVHRLDKDTCGLMIVAKSPAAASKWTKLIACKDVNKEYIAICIGIISPSSGTIKESVIQHGVEKKAVTKYQVEKSWNFDYESQDCSEKKSLEMSQIRLMLDTGRMHQIRIHLAKEGCPIAGDDQHGNFKLNKILKKQFKIKNLLLASVKLTLPMDGKIKVFEIPLPDYMTF